MQTTRFGGPFALGGGVECRVVYAGCESLRQRDKALRSYSTRQVLFRCLVAKQRTEVKFVSHAL